MSHSLVLYLFFVLGCLHASPLSPAAGSGELRWMRVGLGEEGIGGEYVVVLVIRGRMFEGGLER